MIEIDHVALPAGGSAGRHLLEVVTPEPQPQPELSVGRRTIPS